MHIKNMPMFFQLTPEANWNFNESNSVLRTDFTVTTEVKEGFKHIHSSRFTSTSMGTSSFRFNATQY